MNLFKKTTKLFNGEVVKDGDYVRFLSSDSEFINCQVKKRICDNIHCETGKKNEKRFFVYS